MILLMALVLCGAPSNDSSKIHWPRKSLNAPCGSTGFTLPDEQIAVTYVYNSSGLTKYIQNMRKASVLVTAIAGMILLAATPTFAKEKTITGEAKCAKCALKEADKCQTVV